MVLEIFSTWLMQTHGVILLQFRYNQISEMRSHLQCEKLRCEQTKIIK